MEILEDRTVAEIVSSNIKTADVFKKHGIDFCCGGGVSLSSVCDKKGLDIGLIKNELIKANQPISYNENYKDWEIDKLIDYIIEKHHSYVQESLPILLQYADKVAKVHGHHAPEVIEINDLVRAVAEELTMHLHKEEMILFPYVKYLYTAINQNQQIEPPQFGTVKNPIKMMEHEHENAGDSFKRIGTLSNNFTTPEWACNTYKALYAKLEEFETDLHMHIHLENNIVFPAAIKMEEVGF